MLIKLSIFLYIYYSFLAIWAIIFFVGIYHLLRFGFKNFVTFIMTFIFLAMAVILLWTTFYFINQIDWRMEITLFDGVYSNMQPYFK